MSPSLCPALWLSLSLRLCSWPLMKQHTGCISCIRPPLSLALFHPPLSLRDMCNCAHHYYRDTLPSLGKPVITFLLLSLLPRVCPCPTLTAASQQALSLTLLSRVPAGISGHHLPSIYL